jgi:hypothetical protein
LEVASASAVVPAMVNIVSRDNAAELSPKKSSPADGSEPIQVSN